MVMVRQIRFDDQGLRVSVPGVDVLSASPSQLLLAATARVDQLVLQGTAFNGQFVNFSLANVPYVLLTSMQPLDFAAGGHAICRPWPFLGQTYNSYVQVQTNGMWIVGGSAAMFYHVFRRAA